MKRRTWAVLAGLVLAMLLGALAIVRTNAPDSAEASQAGGFSH
jgi:hypothetical protein